MKAAVTVTNPSWGFESASLFNMNQRVKKNLDKILSGELTIKPNPVFTKYLKENSLLGEYRCKECNRDEWLGKKLGLELDHINGDKSNNTKENLRWLCPNCHSATSNFRAKNIKKVFYKDLSGLNQVDFSTKGWRIRAGKILGVNGTRAGVIVKEHLPEIWDKAWKHKDRK